MLACARIGAIHSVVFGGFSPDASPAASRTATSTVVITADEGLRGGRKVPLKANVDEALKACPACKTVHRGQAHRRRRSTGTPAATSGCTRRCEAASRRLPARADERRGPAVHPLHLGLDRQAQGRAAHDRRLSRLRLDDASIRVRLSRRRRLLVHRRCRLGDRAQLYRLWPARQRRDDADVRGRAQLSRRSAASGR